MNYSFDGDAYILALQKGDDLIDSLLAFVKATDLKAAWLNGFGAAMGMELGYFELDKREYRWQKFQQVCEIVSLTGNISRDTKNQPAFHMHGVFADEAYQTVGGHVRNLIAGGTVEIYLREFGQPLKREFDEATGLKLLSL